MGIICSYIVISDILHDYTGFTLSKECKLEHSLQCPLIANYAVNDKNYTINYYYLYIIKQQSIYFSKLY